MRSSSLLLSVSCVLFVGCPREAPRGAASKPSTKPAQAVTVAPPGGFVIGTGQPGFSDDPPQFNKPIRLAPYGPGRVVVADIKNHAIRIVHRGGRVTTLAGAPDRHGHRDGPAATARFDGPHGVAVLPDGSVVVGEASNHTLRRLVPSGQGKNVAWTVETLAGVPRQSGMQDGPSAEAKFASPHGIAAAKDGSILIADIGNARLRRYADGKVTTVAGTGHQGGADGPLAEGTLHMPMDLSVTDDGTFIADAGEQIVRLWRASEGLSTPKPASKWRMPHGVAVDEKGRVIVAEMYANAVTVEVDGKRRTLVDTVKKPADVLVHDGILWIADLDNHQIKGMPWPPAN